MYESPAYWELKKQLSHFELVKSYVDLARTFRTLAYAEDLTLTGKGRFDDRDTSVTLSDSLKGDLLEFAAQRCENVAAKIAASPPEACDVAQACKV